VKICAISQLCQTHVTPLSYAPSKLSLNGKHEFHVLLLTPLPALSKTGEGAFLFAAIANLLDDFNIKVSRAVLRQLSDESDKGSTAIARLAPEIPNPRPSTTSGGGWTVRVAGHHGERRG
jgi:hypothetical protein